MDEDPYVEAFVPPRDVEIYFRVVTREGSFVFITREEADLFLKSWNARGENTP